LSTAVSVVPEPARWPVIGVIAWREAKAALRGLGCYVALTLALLAATWMLLVDVRTLDAAGLLALSDPFRASVEVAMLILALFFAVSAAVSAARDRESGTLEVLFYGPVDELAYVLGKVGGLLIAYFATLPLLLVSLGLLSLMTGFTFGPAVPASLALSIVPAAEIIAFGVLLSVGMGRVRSAVLLLVGVVIVLLGIKLAYGMVLMVPISDPASPVLALRDTLAAIDAGAAWISPFAWLERVVDGALTGAWWTALISLTAALAYTLVMIGLAAWWLRRRGVYRRDP
jgi:ABC-type transport system involved in multi-copper enzyme maturation permease subunit